MANRPLAPGVVTQPKEIVAEKKFNVSVEIIDAVTMEKVQDVNWKVCLTVFGWLLLLATLWGMEHH